MMLKEFMMSKLKLLLLMVMVIVPCQAQSTGDGNQDQNVADQAERPEMPSLFFRSEQRRVLEAVRQGFVEEQDFDIEEFVPVVIIEEALPEEEQAPPMRGKELSFDSYIVNRASGSSIIWVNNEPINAEQDKDVLENDGIFIKGTNTVSDEGVLEGSDEYNDAQFQLQVGQIIGVDGNIDETLPVVIRKRD